MLNDKTRTDLFGIKSLSICKTHTAFVLNDGTLWTAGNNEHGQLCRITPSGSWSSPNLAKVPGVTDAVAVTVSNTENGEGSTVVLRQHNRVWSAGYSTSPTLTVSSGNKRAYTSLGRSSGSGSPTFSNFDEVLGISGVKKILYGRGQLIVLKNDGYFYGFGLDWDANRGILQWMRLKDSNDLPLVCTDLSFQSKGMVALRSDGSVAMLAPVADWHRPSEFPPTTTASLKPLPDESFWAGIRKITTGLSHLAAVTHTGFLHVAGSDAFGQLATVHSKHRNPREGFLLDDTQITDVACGDNHTVILCRDGRVKTAGRNHRGQLGRAVPVGNGHDWLYGTGADRVSREGWFGNCDYIPEIDDAVAVHAGGDSTVIICDDGIHVAGDNEFGQLGVATGKHIINSGDRISWRESWHGARIPFETNLTETALF